MIKRLHKTVPRGKNFLNSKLPAQKYLGITFIIKISHRLIRHRKSFVLLLQYRLSIQIYVFVRNFTLTKDK